MIKITVLTLFPKFIESIIDYSVIGNAIKNSIINLEIVDIREFSLNKHKKVDDEIFGGGAGMLMTPQPVYDAINSVKNENSKIIYMSPQGEVLNQQLCKNLSNEKHIILLCGHYEGIDSRIINNYVDLELSVGDYVLSGGEIPALIVIDSVCRLIENVLGNNESVVTDSHYNENLLQYDVFTRPREFNGICVPEVLFSGNHKKIEEWKKNSSIENTKKKRPDLYYKFVKKNKI